MLSAAPTGFEIRSPSRRPLSKGRSVVDNTPRVRRTGERASPDTSPPGSEAGMRGSFVSPAPTAGARMPTTSVLRNASILHDMRAVDAWPVATPEHPNAYDVEDTTSPGEASANAGLSLLAKLLSPQMHELAETKSDIGRSKPTARVLQKTKRGDPRGYPAGIKPTVRTVHRRDDKWAGEDDEDLSPGSKRAAQRPRRGSFGSSSSSAGARGMKPITSEREDSLAEDAGDSVSESVPSTTGSGSNEERQKRTFTSSYHGVSWHKRSQRWAVQIRNNGKRLHVGYFGDELSAALAYDKVARDLRGDRARVNFDEAGDRASYKKRLGSGVRPRKTHPIPRRGAHGGRAIVTGDIATNGPLRSEAKRTRKPRRTSARDIIAQAPFIPAEDPAEEEEKRRAVDTYFHKDRLDQLKSMRVARPTAQRRSRKPKSAFAF